MKKLLLIVDPLSGKQSVQFDFIKSIAVHLKDYYEVTVTSVLIDNHIRKELEKCDIRTVITRNSSFLINSILKIFGRNNESMLWLESWMREGLFSKNSHELSHVVSKINVDYIINATNTVPVASDIWWIQGPPLFTTLQEISNDNYVSKLAILFAKWFVRSIDRKLLNRMSNQSNRLIANAKSCFEYYTALGLNVSGIIHSAKDFDEFHPTTNIPTRNFVLTYIGKETEIETVMRLAQKGVRIIGFGSKLPIGANIKELNRLITFKGFLGLKDLVDLYSNALFTVFPFSSEPFGNIPLESMACGTAVLTYNKQGPSETVLHGVTGWLVDTSDELVDHALKIWNQKRTGIDPVECIKRSRLFSAKYSSAALKNVLEMSDSIQTT